MRTLRICTAMAGLVALMDSAQATPVFQGRLADGTASSTCTVPGATRCTSFYDSNLDITILNNWDIGTGTWSTSAAAGSAQALAESAGLAATGPTGWTLPTGDGAQGPGGPNQFLSIWNDAGGTLAGLQAQFDGAYARNYWSDTLYAPDHNLAWFFHASSGAQFDATQGSSLYAVAVRPGDVTAAVPEPPTLALLVLGLAVVAARKRSA